MISEELRKAIGSIGVVDAQIHALVREQTDHEVALIDMMFIFDLTRAQATKRFAALCAVYSIGWRECWAYVRRGDDTALAYMRGEHE